MTTTTTTTWEQESPFVRQVQETVRNVLQAYGGGSMEDGEHEHEHEHEQQTKRRTKGKRTSRVDHIPPQDREAVLIARCLNGRLQHARQHNVCPHCWLQRGQGGHSSPLNNNNEDDSSSACFCSQCPPCDDIDNNNAQTTTTITTRPQTIGVRRIFLLLHYREVFMGVDTAKLILRTFPTTTRLVIAGIPAQFQASMAELEQAIADAKGKGGKLCVLFPDEHAQTIDELEENFQHDHDETSSTTTASTTTCSSSSTTTQEGGWAVVVIDGTWQQARRMKLRYFPESSSGDSCCGATTVPTVKLSPTALALLEDEEEGEETLLVPAGGGRSTVLPAGHQLRKHSTPWKRIATFEALRLFLVDCSCRLLMTTAVATSSTTSSKQSEKAAEARPPDWLVAIADYVRIANQAALGRNTNSGG
jgi:DTW domain-containing protein YfiP